ncbi:MAG TPA: hypothetical protein VFG86_05580 [Chloroflexota bacterium]|nr:hypothetical protein [Chloroflexota bacterium]
MRTGARVSIARSGYRVRGSRRRAWFSSIRRASRTWSNRQIAEQLVITERTVQLTSSTSSTVTSSLRISEHASADIVRRYIREGNPFKSNAAGRIGLVNLVQLPRRSQLIRR